MSSSFSTFSSSKYFTKKSFTILSDEDDESMPEQTSEYLPAIINTKVKSVYHQRCTVPNKDFSILHNAIGSKFQTTVTVQHHPISHQSTISGSYPSTEFFNRVSTKLRHLRAPLVAEDSETETDGDKNRKRVMEKPMFITTVRSGAFLEPPPEVAALLGLRRNYSTTLTSTTSSSEKSGNEQSMMYSFASRPRMMKAHYQTASTGNETRREKRDLEDESVKATKDEGSTFYGNTMFDRRVARGSNFASFRPNAPSIEHVQSRQAEARRRAAVRQRAQIRARKLRMGTPPPVDGRKHEQMQTDKCWEDITEKPPENSIACQADFPADFTSHSDLFTNSGVNGEDVGTQIDPGDLPTSDDQIHTVVTYIVNKILREAIFEINEEIEKFQCCSYSEKVKKDREITFNENSTDVSAVIIGREELLGLIEAAIQYLKSIETPDASLERIEKMGNGRLLEITVREIRTIVRDIKFISEIIQRRAQNFYLDEHGESSSTQETETNLEEVVPITTDQVEASNVVRNEESQETEAVIVDTDKTDHSSVVEKADDELGEGGAEIKEETTIEDGNEKTDVSVTKELTNDYELEVTKNETIEKEKASMAQNDKPTSFDTPEKIRTDISQREEEVLTQIENESEIELEDPKLITEEENYPSDDEPKTIQSLSQNESQTDLKSIQDSAPKLDSEPLQKNDQVSDSSIVQATNPESQEPEIIADNIPLETNIEGLANENLGPSSSQINDTTVTDGKKINNSDEEKGQSQKKIRENEDDSQIFTEDTASKTCDNTGDHLADETDRIDPHNQKSTEDDQNFELGHSAILEDEAQSDERILSNDISKEGVEVETLKDGSLSQVEKEIEDSEEGENTTSHTVDKTLVNDENNVPTEIYKDDSSKEVIVPENSVSEKDNLSVTNDNFEETLESPPAGQTDGEDLLSVEKVDDKIISSAEDSSLKNESFDGQIQSEGNSVLQKSILREETSSERPISPPPEPTNDSKSGEKIEKARSLESDSVNMIKSTDISALRRMSSLPNPNYEDTIDAEEITINGSKEKRYKREITPSLQNEEINDAGTLDHAETVQEQSTNEPSRAELTDSAIAVEDQILPEEDVTEKSTMGTGGNESLETTELSNQKSSSLQSDEPEPTSISSTMNTTQSSTLEKSSRISKTEMKSKKLLRHEETVSDELAQKNDLKDIQSSDSKETTEISSTTIPEEKPAEDSDPQLIAQDKSEDVKSDNGPSNEDITVEPPPNSQTMPSEQTTDTFTGERDGVGEETKHQKSTNTDLDDEEDSDNMEIEGTRIVEETFTETTKTYKEISIRETTLVEREFIEYTTADDDLEHSNSNFSSKKSSRESTASDSTKQEIFINIERPLSSQDNSVRPSKLSTNGKESTSNTQNHNGTVLMREA